jgi:tripartite-type tricarboxylate transporter receptor subunit TctC
VIATLHDAAVAALADPEIRQRLESGGAIPVGSTPDELAAHVRTELDKWAPVVDAAGVRIN